ncbi:restriction endonuclease subunit S [Streptomyces sp. NPDC006197]|uniref:restriction endonuclease subunit S n=1 Tax=Streptomyces sp. NPDC006197 TaxID=3156685 RepID=UPI0033AA3CD1
MSEWSRTTVGDVMTLQRGFDITKAQQAPGDVPVVSSGGIGSYHDTAMVKGPGVVMGRKGTLGKVYYLEGDYWPHDTTLWVKDFKGNDPRFVYYFLGTLDFLSMDVGSSNPTLNRNHVHPVPVQWPPLAEQRAISALLGALDEKISNNESIAARALDLGTEEFRLLSASAQERFTLGDVVELRYGKALAAHVRTPGDVPVFGSGGVGGYHAEALVRGPGIIVGRKGTVGSVYWSDADFFPIDTTFYVARRTDRVSLEYMYFALRSLGLEHMNADSAVPGLNRDRAHSLGLSVPAENAMREFTSKVNDLFSLRRSRFAESAVLATLRDTLLPQLMSGRLRIKDAEKIVEDNA